MKINDKSQTYIVIAIIIFAFYYLIIKPTEAGIKNIFSLSDSEDKKAVEKEVQDKLSPLNKNLWHTYFYQPPATPNGRKKISGVYQLAAPNMVKDLKKNFGILSDNEDGIFEFFSRFNTQSECSYFAQVFEEIYKKDLITFLRTGFNFLPENGINDKKLNKIIKAMRNLNFK